MLIVAWQNWAVKQSALQLERASRVYLQNLKGELHTASF
jgi:hypothetical protein